MRALDADVPVVLISVTPTPARFAEWDEIAAFNDELETIAAGLPGVTYLDTAPHYLGPDGRPRADLFGPDRLHQNAAGYAVWAELLRGAVEEL